jgi:hypothetical protein
MIGPLDAAMPARHPIIPILGREKLQFYDFGGKNCLWTWPQAVILFVKYQSKYRDRQKNNKGALGKNVVFCIFTLFYAILLPHR